MEGLQGYISGVKAGNMIWNELGGRHYKDLYEAMKKSCRIKIVGSGRATRYYYLEEDVLSFIGRLK